MKIDFPMGLELSMESAYTQKQKKLLAKKDFGMLSEA
jgi:hypothetical protein